MYNIFAINTKSTFSLEYAYMYLYFLQYIHIYDNNI